MKETSSSEGSNVIKVGKDKENVTVNKKWKLSRRKRNQMKANEYGTPPQTRSQKKKNDMK